MDKAARVHGRPIGVHFILHAHLYHLSSLALFILCYTNYTVPGHVTLWVHCQTSEGKYFWTESFCPNNIYKCWSQRQGANMDNATWRSYFQASPLLQMALWSLCTVCQSAINPFQVHNHLLFCSSIRYIRVQRQCCPSCALMAPFNVPGYNSGGDGGLWFYHLFCVNWRIPTFKGNTRGSFLSFCKWLCVQVPGHKLALACRKTSRSVGNDQKFRTSQSGAAAADDGRDMGQLQLWSFSTCTFNCSAFAQRAAHR